MAFLINKKEREREKERPTPSQMSLTFLDKSICAFLPPLFVVSVSHCFIQLCIAYPLWNKMTQMTIEM